MHTLTAYDRTETTRRQIVRYTGFRIVLDGDTISRIISGRSVPLHVLSAKIEDQHDHAAMFFSQMKRVTVKARSPHGATTIRFWLTAADADYFAAYFPEEGA